YPSPARRLPEYDAGGREVAPPCGTPPRRHAEWSEGADYVQPDCQRVRDGRVAARVDEVLQALPHVQARSNGASVGPLQRHFPTLDGSCGVGHGLNHLRTPQVAAVRAVRHAETGKVARATRQEAVRPQPGVEEVRYLVAPLVRHTHERREHAQMSFLCGVAPARDRLVAQEVEAVAGPHGLTRLTCRA